MPALDGLRGLAVAGVLLFHGDHLSGGFLGVDLFFVLSGFLITSLLLAESTENGGIGLGGFWSRRARRLLPAFAGVMVGVAIYCLVFAEPSELARIRGDGLASLFYVANWRSIFAGQDYWAMFQSPSPFEHTWSLAIEEQFYLLWPLIFVGILALFRHATARAILVVSLVLAAGSTILMWALYNPADVSRVYYGTDTRATALLLGVALAAGLSAWGPVKSRAGRIALETVGFLGVAFLAFTWITVDGGDSWLYEGGFLLCGLSVIAIIAAAAHPEAGPLSKALGWKPLCLLGLISYGVYLWHWPLYIVLSPERTGLDGWPLFAVRVGVTLIVAVASFILLETPIRRGAMSARQWRVLTPVAAGALVLIIIGATAASEPSPMAASTVDAPVGAAEPGAGRGRLRGDDAGTGHPGCGIQRGERGPPRIPARQRDHGVQHPAEVPSLAGRTGPGRSRSTTRPSSSSISGAWDLFDVIPPHQTKAIAPGSTAWNADYERTIRRVVHVVSAGGAHVVIPTIPFFNTQGLLGQRTNTVRSSFNPERVKIANSILKKLDVELGDSLSVPDLNHLLAPTGKFQRALHGMDPIQSDGVHFTPQSAAFVGRWMVKQLAPWVTPHAPSRDAPQASSPTP